MPERSLWRGAATAIYLQRELIARKDAEIRSLQRCVLAHQQGYIDLVAAWRISLDRPDVNLSEELDLMLEELSWNMAQTQAWVT